VGSSWFAAWPAFAHGWETKSGRPGLKILLGKIVTAEANKVKQSAYFPACRADAVHDAQR
jgi:hypothetical protein